MSRLVESMVIFAIILIAAIAAAGPVIASGVAGGFNLSAQDPGEYVRRYLFAHPILVAYLLLLISIASLAALAVHSWIEAGSFGVYLEGESRAARAAASEPDPFTVFTIDLWVSLARRFWWSFFILYNVIWGIYLIILLLPLIAVATLVVVTGASQTGMVAGCAALVLWAIIALFGSLITQAWSQLSLAVMVDRSLTVGASLRAGWSLLWRKLGDVLVSVVLILGISLLMGILAAAFFVGIDVLDDMPGGGLIIFPFQMIVSFTQAFFSLFLSGWITAAFVAIASRAGRDPDLEQQRSVMSR